MKLKRIVIAVMAMVMMLCSTVMAAEGGKLDIKLTDTDLLPRSVKIQIIDTPMGIIRKFLCQQVIIALTEQRQKIMYWMIQVLI